MHRKDIQYAVLQKCAQVEFFPPLAPAGSTLHRRCPPSGCSVAPTNGPPATIDDVLVLVFSAALAPG